MDFYAWERNVALSPQMQEVDEQQPGDAVVSDHADQIVHCRDQRSGSDCRIHVYFFENIGTEVPTILEIVIAISRAMPAQSDIAKAYCGDLSLSRHR